HVDAVGRAVVAAVLADAAPHDRRRYLLPAVALHLAHRREDEDEQEGPAGDGEDAHRADGAAAALLRLPLRARRLDAVAPSAPRAAPGRDQTADADGDEDQREAEQEELP